MFIRRPPPDRRLGTGKSSKNKTTMPPLAERLRPRTLDDYIGQEHLVGPGAVLRQAIDSGQIPSFILWGPPGVGKTTLAGIIAATLERPFQTLSAINSGVKDIREAIDRAKKQRFFNSPNPILFIDEIHRFSKSQQDSLLGAVEKGVITLIGATTENPSFEVISALLSRCQVYVLKSHDREALVGLLDRALLEDAELKAKNVTIQEYDALLRLSGGDARRLLNLLELVTNFATDTGSGIVITDELVTAKVQQNMARYDKTGEQHYDIASALIKSIRGSDPNAALYWLARMLAGGESVEFVARRLVISASEDVGMANPNALLLATTTMQAIRMVGMPEARIVLGQCVTYLATSPKSNASYAAIGAALAEVKRSGDLPVPLHLRNAPTKLMRQLDYGRDYDYAHGHPGSFVDQDFAPEELGRPLFYEPGDNPSERTIRERLRRWWPRRYPAG